MCTLNCPFLEPHKTAYCMHFGPEQGHIFSEISLMAFALNVSLGAHNRVFQNVIPKQNKQWILINKGKNTLLHISARCIVKEVEVTNPEIVLYVEWPIKKMTITIIAMRGMIIADTTTNT